MDYTQLPYFDIKQYVIFSISSMGSQGVTKIYEIQNLFQIGLVKN